MSPWTDPDPTRTFDGRALLYQSGRPGYPEASVDFLLAGLGAPPESLRVADVGAGTALLARLFVGRGCRVVAVEPDADMRAAAPPTPGLEWLPTSAEETGLPSASVHLLTLAQAFHWVDTERGLPEFQRVLVPGGRLAVLWNDRIVESAFEREYHARIRELKPELRRDSPPKDSALALCGSPLFDEPQLTVFEHSHVLDADALVARTLSLSYAPRDEPLRSKLAQELRRFHAGHADAAGRVVQRYAMRVHVTHARR